MLGLLRDAAIAFTLGDSRVNDIFNAAFEIPNLARRVLGEGALSAFIVPVYHGEEKAGGRERAFLFFNRALTTMVLIGGLLAALGVLAAQPLFIAFGGLKFVVDGDAQSLEYLELGARLTRIMFPYVLVLTLASLFMGVCHAHRRFLTPALGSSAINVVIIIVALWASGSQEPAFAVCLAWAVIGGVSIRLALMVPTLWRLGWRPRADFKPRDPAMKSLFAKMGAATFAAGLAQINISINLIFAFWCMEGAVTYLRYGNRLIQFPLALLAASLATALVPSISKHYVNGDFGEARNLAKFATRVMLVLTLPAMVGLWALGEPVLGLIFERGAWDDEATRSTALALSMYAAGLVPMALMRLLVPLYYAKGDVMTPVKVAAGALVVNVVANWLLMQTFLNYAGLALGATIAATFNSWLLWSLLKRDIGSLWDRALGVSIMKCSLAAAAMGVVCWQGYVWWDQTWPAVGLLARVIQVSALCASGVGLYFVFAYALKLSDLRDAIALVRRRSTR